MTINTIRKAVIALFVSLEILCFILLPFAAQEAKTAEVYGRGKSLTVRVTKASNHIYKASSHNYKATIYWNGRKQTSYTFAGKPRIIYKNTDSLTFRELTHRKDKSLVIEVLTGKQINDAGDGQLFVQDHDHDYIKYHGFLKGDMIRTYCVYDPSTSYIDDVAERFDEKIK